MQLVSYNQALEEGLIIFSREHIRRLVKAGKFPPPIRVGDRANAWDKSELIAHNESRRVQITTTPNK
jgi:predicted DNA-binding transcriptional regulator AlpA